MKIQKKSLISNRTATKKALTVKPTVAKAGITRVELPKPRLVVHARNRVVMG